MADDNDRPDPEITVRFTNEPIRIEHESVPGTAVHPRFTDWSGANQPGIPVEEFADRLLGLERREDELRSLVESLLDGLDAWAGRIQRLEALPGVAEALQAIANTEAPRSEKV